MLILSDPRGGSLSVKFKRGHGPFFLFFRFQVKCIEFVLVYCAVTMVSLVAVALLLCACIPSDDPLSMQILLLLSAIIASRQDTRRSRNMIISLLRSSIRRGRIRNSTTNEISKANILRVIKDGSDTDFKDMFRLSRPVFLALLHDLSPWLKDGRSRNSRKNVPAEMKIGIALYYMAHGGDGKNLVNAYFYCQCLFLTMPIHFTV